MTWVKTQGVFTNKPWHKSWLVSESWSKSRCRSARWWLAPRLTFEYHNQTGICFTNTRNYCHRNKIYVLTSQVKQICLQPAVCANILHCEHGVSPSRIHVLAHPWKAMLLLWIGDDVTIVAIEFEWKNLTQTKQRRDMRLTSWLTPRLSQWFSFVNTTWLGPGPSPEVRLGPGPSQVLSQVSSQDC